MVSFCLEKRIPVVEYNDSCFFSKQKKQIKEYEYEVKNKDILVLDNVLSVEECEKIIYLHAENFTTEGEGKKSRSKICVLIQELSDVIMKRCGSYIKDSVYIENNIKTPGGHYTYYKYWDRPEINPVWRIVKCDKGSNMSKHFDGVYVKSVDYKSIYTVMLYLTDNNDGALNIENMLVYPKKGRICIFNQSLIHEGSLNINEKYYVRSELLYKREKSCATVDDMEAMKLLEEAKRVYDEDKDLSYMLEQKAYKLSSKLEDIVLNL